MPARAKAPRPQSKTAADIDLSGGDRLITRSELARLSGLSQKTLRTLDCEGRGCPGRVKRGAPLQGRVYYLQSIAEQWLASSLRPVGRPAISQT